mmetsp:Transcript_79383/g.125229  ORF Transcript_79383/g.125229 Transcript_79383/m.125229 type:complete len:448 (-) Transcript_79383:103-1446(-)
MATQRVSELGTSLTPGFTELLTNWDQVLKSLDRLSAYTTERANEEAEVSVRLSGLRRDRPRLFGETPDGSEWQSLQKPGGYPPKVKEMPEHLQEPRFTGIDLQSVRPRGGGVVLERLERRVAQQEAQNLLQLLINSWRCVSAQAVLASEVVAGEEVKAQDLTEEKLHRLQEVRRSRCTDALTCWQQVQRRDTLSATFQVWREEIRRQAEALQKERLRQSTLDAAQASEVQCQLRRELEKSRAAEEAAAAQASSTRMALHVAEEELARLKAELATSNQLLQEKQAAATAATAATAADPMKESQRSRQLTDLSIKLARAEAEVSEAKSQVEPLTAQLGMARGQLEVAYGLLNKEKGTTRDRDLAVTHLWQVLERLQDVAHPEEKNEKKLGLSTSPSAMSTPNIQSSLSLPSLSSASSPSVRSRSKPSGGPEPREPRERTSVQRWTAPWS